MLPHGNVVCLLTIISATLVSPAGLLAADPVIRPGAAPNQAPSYSGQVTPVELSPNDAATVDLLGRTFSNPIPVSALLAGFVDLDGDTLGLAITAMDANKGIWKVSQDAEATWTQLAAPDSGTGIYLAPSDKLRFFYTAHTDIEAFTLDSVLTFRAWDGRDGLAASPTARALPSTPDATSAVSAELNHVNLPVFVTSATVTFNPIAPVLAVAGKPMRFFLDASSNRVGAPKVVFSTALPSSIAFQGSWAEGTLTTAGLTTLTIQADDRYAGSATQTVNIQVLPPDPLPLTAPVLPTTGSDGVARFSTVGGCTDEGLARLRAALAGKDATQVRAFAWKDGAYAELLGDQPTWLTPTHGVFVVTRLDLGLTLDGVPQAMPGALTLQPGWNLLTVPLLTTDGVTPIASHPWKYFWIEEDNGTTTPASLTIPAPYLWDGAAYIQITTLTSGVGYWFNNTTKVELRLVRTSIPTPAPTLPLLAARGLAAQDDTPPPPPGATISATKATDTSSAGSCGLGNGLAGLLMLMLAALRMYVVRSGSRR